MSARARTRVREIVHASDPALAAAHRLLRSIFSKPETVSRIEWRHSLREREAGLWTDICWHLVVIEQAGRVIGVSTGTYLGNVQTGVIGYLAVSPRARGLGIGPRLRARLRRLFQKDARQLSDAPLRAIVGEVERDNPWLRILTRRGRVLALDLRYYQPRLRRGGHPVPLIFYYEPLGPVPKRLSVPMVRRLLYTIWRRIYRIPRPLTDPAFRHILRDLAGRTTIGAIKLDPH